MIPRHFYRLVRKFSGFNKGSGRSAVFKFNVAFIVTSVCLVNGFLMFSAAQVDRKARSRRYEHMDNVLKKKNHFEGVEREDVKRQLFEILEKSNFVVVFAPAFQGKTQFVKYLDSLGNVVSIPAMENFEEFMNFWGYEDKYTIVHFNEFMGLIDHVMTKNKDKVFIIDEYEKISDMHMSRLSHSLYYLANNKAIKIVIFTNSESVANNLTRSYEAKVFPFPDMNEDEFSHCFEQMKNEQKGLNTSAKQLWEKIGFDLQYAKEFAGTTTGIDVFLQEKKQFFNKELEGIDENFKDVIKKALDCVNQDAPLGDVFKGSKLANFLLRVGAGRGYLGTVKFRNKFVVSVFQDFISSGSGKGIN